MTKRKVNHDDAEPDDRIELDAPDNPFLLAPEAPEAPEAPAQRPATGSGLGLTDHLLALVLIETASARGNRPLGELAWRLRSAGLTLAQAAAVLDKTSAETQAAQTQWEAARPR